MSEQRGGIGYGVAAFAIWGLMPLYFPLLKPASAFEILAHRMVWALVFVLALLALRRDWSWLPWLARSPRKLGLLAVAAVVIAGNWGIYVWGVNHGHVVGVALGYYINPLISVVLGVAVLRERLRGLQWISVGVAAAAVGVLTVEYGHPPWIALGLAGCFATYGFVKKRADVATRESLAVETGFQFIPATIFLLVLHTRGGGTFTDISAGHTLLLVSAGLATAVPLLFFGAAAVRIPLSILGLLQYMTPTLQFLIGVLIYREAMPPGRWAGFSLVWIALSLLTWDGLREARGRWQAGVTARRAAPSRYGR